MRRLAILFALLASVSAALAADAVVLTPEQERRAVGLYGELKCPVCKSQSVAASTSFLSEEMKRQIREFLAAGKSDQEIKEHFVARYGEWILLEPKTTGRGLWAWIVPGLVLTLGVTWLGWQLWRWSAQTATPQPLPSTSDDSQLDVEQRQKIRALVEG